MLLEKFHYFYSTFLIIRDCTTVFAILWRTECVWSSQNHYSTLQYRKRQSWTSWLTARLTQCIFEAQNLRASQFNVACVRQSSTTTHNTRHALRTATRILIHHNLHTHTYLRYHPPFTHTNPRRQSQVQRHTLTCLDTHIAPRWQSYRLPLGWSTALLLPITAQRVPSAYRYKFPIQKFSIQKR